MMERGVKFTSKEAAAIGERLRHAWTLIRPQYNRVTFGNALGISPQAVDRMLAGGGSLAGWAKAARVLKTSLDHLILGVEVDPEVQRLIVSISERTKAAKKEAAK